MSGAFDCFTEFNRAQYFAPNEKGENFVEQLIKFGSHVQGQKESIQISLFGEEMQDMILEPKPEKVQEWNQIEKLEKERKLPEFILVVIRWMIIRWSLIISSIALWKRRTRLKGSY